MYLPTWELVVTKTPKPIDWTIVLGATKCVTHPCSLGILRG